MSMFTNLPREFFIPPKTEVIFVQDFFAKELIGGAELTSDAIIKACPHKLFELHSQSITEAMIQKHRDKLWVFGNITMVQPYLLDLFRTLDISYYCVEYDYKWCVYRSKQLHQMKEGKECDCENKPHGKFYKNYFLAAKQILFMSELQRKDCVIACGKAIEETSTVVSSMWTKDELALLTSLRKAPKKDSWVILSGASWIKNQQEAERYCKDNQLSYELVGGLPYLDFLKKISSYKGLVFLPAGDDTCPRITVEAKLMGLELILNDKVLHATEAWFNRDVPEIEDYLLDGPSRFWRAIEKSL